MPARLKPRGAISRYRELFSRNASAARHRLHSSHSAARAGRGGEGEQTAGPGSSSSSSGSGSGVPSTRLLLPAGSVVFSGIQPTGMPHLGNYLGALREWVRIQDDAPPDARLLFCVVDLHAMTVPPGGGGGGAWADALRKCKREALAMLIAVGLVPERCCLFWQSDVSLHTRAWRFFGGEGRGARGKEVPSQQQRPCGERERERDANGWERFPLCLCLCPSLSI